MSLPAPKALNLWEYMQSLLEGLEDYIETLPASHKEEGQHHLKSFQQLADLLDTDTTFTPLHGSIAFPTSKIERLGIGGEIVRLRTRMTLQELADKFNLTAPTVSRFLKRYDKMKASEKSQVRRHSVFDIFDRLEELSAMIYRQLAALENQPETHVKYIAELRQTLDLAARLAKELYTIRKYEQFKSAVVEVLLSELPERRRELQQRFALLAHLAPVDEDV